MSHAPLRLAVLLSGRGTTLANLLEQIRLGRVPAEVVLVISSNPRAYGLELAREAGIEAAAIEPRAAADLESYSLEVFQRCRAAAAELVVLAGFLKLLRVPDDFAGRIVNIHPSLIPAFCGKGYYGHHVHQAVLDYGAKVSGCTVHFVDNQYDHGPIILQRVVPVEPGDTVEALAARVFRAECEAYPEAIRLFAQRRLKIEGRQVTILPAGASAAER